MKKIFVFDMGCVILKPANLRGMHEDADTSCDYKRFRDLFYNSEHSQKVYEGVITDDEFFRFIKDSAKSNRSVEELKLLYLKYKGGVYRSTLKLINQLREDGNMVCLLSNLKAIDHAYLSSVVDMQLFDRAYLSYLMGMAKPDEKIFQAVIADLGTNQFYFFDDSLRNIDMASSLGINAYNVTGENIEDCFEKKLVLKRNNNDYK